MLMRRRSIARVAVCSSDGVSFISKLRPRWAIEDRRKPSVSKERIILGIMKIIHIWWAAQCRSCGEWIFLQFAGVVRPGHIVPFEEPISIPGKCPKCGQENEYGGADLHQRPGPNPHELRL